MRSLTVGIESIALPGEGSRAIEIEDGSTETGWYLRAECRLAAEVPLRIRQRDRQTSFALEGLEIGLLRSVGLWTAGGELRGKAHTRRNRRRPERQLGDETGEGLGVEAEERAHPGDDGRGWLKAERRTSEIGVLALRDSREIELAVRERYFGGAAENRRRRLLEYRVLFVLDGD